MGKRLAKRVLWIGWDAADWKMINPLLDQGLMPNLEKLINGGVMGNLATLDPPMSPTLWTSMSTGKRPYKHGIHGFTEIDPSGTGVRPSYITSRKVKAIWNMLEHHDLKTHQVGWWPSHPAEPTKGIYVSNFWHKAGKEKNRFDWPLAPGCVHPKEMEDIFKELRVHPSELTSAHLSPFVPELKEALKEKNPKFRKLINSVRKITTDAACIQSAATYILEHHDFDLMCVYFDAIDHYGHGFMKYNPPRRPHISEDLFRYFKDVNKSGYRYHDMMLGRLVDLAGPETTIVLVSDHGFHPDHLRPTQLPIKEEPAAPALEHSPFGIFVAKGPGIKKDELIFGASLIDMCPTILTLFGLPIAKDFDGKPLVNIFEEIPEISAINSWEDIEGECGQHEDEISMDLEQAKAEMQQLIDLGYIEDHGGNTEKAIENTVKTNRYFLARAYVDGGKQEEAMPLYEELWDEYRDNIRFGIRLANCYLSLNLLSDAEETVEQVLELSLRDTPNLLVLKGSLLLKQKKFKKAADILLQAHEMVPKSTGINIQLGRAQMKLRQYKKAKESAMRELEINYENADAHRLLGRIHFFKKNYEEAIECALTGIGLKYHFPRCHELLGDALFKVGNVVGAAEAYEVALHMFNRFHKVRQKLIRLNKNFLKNEDRASELNRIDRKLKEEFQVINLIAGFDYSGLDFFLDRLDESGFSVYKNSDQVPDDKNKSKFDHPGILDIHHDKYFLNNINAEVLKIDARKLGFLPLHEKKYKVVFVRRDLREIVYDRIRIASGTKQEYTLDLKLLSGIRLQEKRLRNLFARRKNFILHEVSYEDLMESELKVVQSAKDFFSTPI